MSHYNIVTGCRKLKFWSSVRLLVLPIQWRAVQIVKEDTHILVWRNSWYRKREKWNSGDSQHKNYTSVLKINFSLSIQWLFSLFSPMYVIITKYKRTNENNFLKLQWIYNTSTRDRKKCRSFLIKHYFNSKGTVFICWFQIAVTKS